MPVRKPWATTWAWAGSSRMVAPFPAAGGPAPPPAPGRSSPPHRPRPRRRLPLLPAARPRPALFVLLLPGLVALAAMVAAPAARGQQVFLEHEAALRQAFPEADAVHRVALFDMPAVTERRIERAAGVRLLLTWTECHQGVRDGAVTAYACIDNMIGKERPITYLTRIGHPDGRIDFVEVMVYRESVGAEVRFPAFRQQFEGKSAEDPVRVSRDIRKISGATLSSRALADGARKLLSLYRHYLSGLPVLNGAADVAGR